MSTFLCSSHPLRRRSREPPKANGPISLCLALSPHGPRCHCMLQGWSSPRDHTGCSLLSCGRPRSSNIIIFLLVVLLHTQLLHTPQLHTPVSRLSSPQSTMGSSLKTLTSPWKELSYLRQISEACPGNSASQMSCRKPSNVRFGWDFTFLLFHF